MRLTFSLPKFRIRPSSRLLAYFSVRTRIIVLALIPVAGFLANGLTYLSGESEVGSAFQTVKHSAVLADASRDFKSAIASMRITLKDFSAAPSDELIRAFGRYEQISLTSLNTVASSVDDDHRKSIESFRRRVAELKSNFDMLAVAQQTLGFREIDGLRGQLGSAGINIERIINDNLSWLEETDANKLMMSLMAMRQAEAEYRVNTSELIHQQFLAAYGKFTTDFSNIDGTPVMKETLEKEVVHYSNTF
jgi:methyl-accepting chemotaxis protein